MTCEHGQEGRVCEAERLAWAGNSPGRTCSHTGCDSDRTGSWTLPVPAPRRVRVARCGHGQLSLHLLLCAQVRKVPCREGDVGGFHSECTPRAARSEKDRASPVHQPWPLTRSPMPLPLAGPPSAALIPQPLSPPPALPVSCSSQGSHCPGLGAGSRLFSSFTEPQPAFPVRVSSRGWNVNVISLMLIFIWIRQYFKGPFLRKRT